MQGDIRPPGPPKTNTQKKRPESALAKLAIRTPAVITKADLPDTNPQANTKKISLTNIRGNLRPKHWYNLTREEQWVMLGGSLAVLLAVVLSSYLLVFQRPPTMPAAHIVPHIKKPAAPTTVASPLSGLQVDPALAKRPITGVMIENSTFARPQSGLQDAGVVYEAIAEAGITRFLALFQDRRPQYIGPVRSLRPYYIDFATPFDASIAHVGGSPDALSQIRSGGKDLDQFFNSGAYWRIGSRDAPHNVYTSFDRLDSLNQSKGYTSSNAQVWPRKADRPLKVPTAKSIDFSISSALYSDHYDYDAASNSYLRSEGGAHHMDLVSADDTAGVQLKPKVVIALVLPLTNGQLDSSGAYYSDYTTTGSGNVYIFEDGGVTQGTWTKADRTSQFAFTDSAGHPVKLDAGQTWISVVGSDSDVKYSP